MTSATAFETSLAQATGWSDGGELAWTGAARGRDAGQTVALDAFVDLPKSADA